MSRSLPLRLRLLVGSLPLLLVALPTRAEEEPVQTQAVAYAKNIRLVHADIDDGQFDKARRRMEQTDETLRSFEFDYLQTRLASADPAGDLVRSLPNPDVETRYGVLDEVGRHVVFICRDGSLRVYDLKSPEAASKTVFHPNRSAIWSGTFSGDCKTFFSGHASGEVIVWDSATWEVRHAVSTGSRPVREIDAAPDGTTFVAEGEKELQLWSLAGDEPKRLAGVGERYNFGEGLAYSPRGDLLATGGMFDVVLHDARTGDVLESITHASYTMGLKFSPDGKQIASAPRGNVNKLLAVFDVDRKEALFHAGPFAHYIAGLAFTPDGKRLAATGCENVLRVFDATSGEIVLALKRQECTAKPAFSRDGRLLGWNEAGAFRYIDLGKPPIENPM